MPHTTIPFIPDKTNSFQGYPLKRKKLETPKLVSYIAGSTALARKTSLLIIRQKYLMTS